MKTRKINKIRRVLTAWETLAPTKSFGGFTLEQFKAAVQPVFDGRDKLAALDSEFADTETRLENDTQDGHDATLRVVNTVKGDPEHGENSPLYAAMGYIPKSNRNSGLSRKAQAAKAVAPKPTT
jgi:hypothetical protein